MRVERLWQLKGRHYWHGGNNFTWKQQNIQGDGGSEKIACLPASPGHQYKNLTKIINPSFQVNTTYKGYQEFFWEVNAADLKLIASSASYKYWVSSTSLSAPLHPPGRVVCDWSLFLNLTHWVMCSYIVYLARTTCRNLTFPVQWRRQSFCCPDRIMCFFATLCHQ